MKLPFAEDLNYWKTGKSKPGKWLDNAEDIIEKLGGEVTLTAKGMEAGHSAYCMDFNFGDESFKAIWPVLPTKCDDNRAAERQAATMLFYDVKSRVIKCAIFGPRTAFFDFLLLENGQPVSQLTNRQLIEYIPDSIK